MATTKTAISIDSDLFKAFDKLARRKRIPRSRLFSEAVREYLQREQSDELTRSWNRVYSDPNIESDEDRAFRRAAVRGLFKRLRRDKW